MLTTFIVDFDTVDRDLAKLKWHLHNAGYATRWGTVNGKRQKVYAHRIVLARKLGRKLMRGEMTDHINRDKLDNRRENLRVADKSINTINRDLDPRNTSGYKGVYLEWRNPRWSKSWYWIVQRRGRKIKYGTHHKTPLEAFLARQEFLKSIGEA